MNLSAINNSSIDSSMSLEEVLHAAQERLDSMNRDRTITTATVRSTNSARWRTLVETAREVLPPSLRPFVRATRESNRDDFPTGIAVSIDLPECVRIHFGPWVYANGKYEIAAPWRNKPFEVAGGNREEFGDLLDAIARAREVYLQYWKDDPTFSSE